MRSAAVRRSALKRSFARFGRLGLAEARSTIGTSLSPGVEKIPVRRQGVRNRFGDFALLGCKYRFLRSRLGNTRADSAEVTEPRPKEAVAELGLPPNTVKHPPPGTPLRRGINGAIIR